jgi:hypothetical protein
MATKKQTDTPASSQVDYYFDDALPEFKEIVSTMPVPQDENDEERRVRSINESFDTAVTYLRTLRDAYHDGEVQEMFSTAIAHAVTAQMWAVRAVKRPA